MTRSVRFFRRLLVLAVLLLVSGCLPSAQSQLDEEREPHFLAGKARVSTMDYPGAIEAFEKALEVNPQSASAHFELAWLYEQKQGDPAAAIYHYQKYLQLRPQAENADLAKQHILFCKQALASTVSLGPISQKQQHDLEQLAEQNKQLTDQNKKLTDQLAQWQLYFARHGVELTNPPPAQTVYRPKAEDKPAAVQSTLAAEPQAQVPRAATRSHTVREGETLAQIARKYGVKLGSLLEANPRLDPRRLRVGQTIGIPAP